MKSHILLIDDDAGIRNLYGKLLRDEGYEVYLSPNAKFAAEVLFMQDLDLVLLDINLPDFGGEMMFDVIRDYNPKLKIMVASVYPLAHQKKWIPKATAYFDKAQGARALLETIRVTLNPDFTKQSA